MQTPDTASTSVAADENPVGGATLCAMLDEAAPKLKANGSPEGAFAALTVDLTNWIGEHPGTAADLDDVAATTCPDTRDDVVASLGTDSFTAAFE